MICPKCKKQNNKEEEKSEKRKIRSFLREKDLKKHLKGKKSIENVENEDIEEETKKYNRNIRR